MAAAATAPGAVSAACPIMGELDRFNRRRRHHRPIAMQLHREPELRSVADAIANCADFLSLGFPLEDAGVGRALLQGGQFCNRRLCPFCEWRRTRVWRARLIPGVDQFLAANPKHKAVFLTLTVRNCQPAELRETIRAIHAAWKQLADQRWFPSDTWFRRTEITASPWTPAKHGDLPKRTDIGNGAGAIHPVGSVHPHIHALLLVRSSYFKKHYISHLRWQKEWMMAARLDYPPIVHVAVARDRRNLSQDGPVSSVSPVVETAKYMAKATDLLSFGSALPEIHCQLKGLRLYGVSKGLRPYVQSAEPTAADFSETSPANDAIGAPILSCVARWYDHLSEYRITP